MQLVFPENKSYCLVPSPVEFPWYDSPWLQSYVTAKRIISEIAPEKLPEFVAVLGILQAPPSFEVKKVREVLSQSDLEMALDIVRDLKAEDYEQHEVLQFGRQIVHNEPEFTRLQQKLTERVSELAEEELEPSYNFLSLYNNLGVCAPHMDAPSAKWTLDICLEQSESWPIYFSQCVPWPEKFTLAPGADGWVEQIKNDSQLEFRAFELESNEALFFAGGNQWHYRERIARSSGRNFCNLLFLHFIPKGCADLVNPARWHELFSIPELSDLKSMSLRSGDAVSP